MKRGRGGGEASVNAHSFFHPTSPPHPHPSLLSSQWLDQCPDLRDDITSISRRPLSLAEAKTARHAFVLGSGARLKPVARWDEAEMGAIGEPALLLTRLVELFESDRDPMKCPDDHMHVDVPFQILVGAGRSND